MKLSPSILTIAASLVLTAPAVSAFQFQSRPRSSIFVSVSNKAASSSTLFQAQLPTQPRSSALHAFVFETTTSKSTTTALSSTANSDEIDLFEEANAIFDTVDDNGDGMITLEELKSHLVDQMGYTTKYTTFLFESMDVDSNNSISREEFRFAFYNFDAVSLYLTMGVGGKDLTSSEAFKKISKQLAATRSPDTLLLDDLSDMIFDMIDTDDSGEIDTAELRSHFDTVTAQMGEAGTDMQAKEYVEDIMTILDANKDGVVERNEMRTAFSKFDFKFLVQTFGLRVFQNKEA